MVNAYQFFNSSVQSAPYASIAFFAEPLLTFRFGGDIVKFNTQLGASFRMVDANPNFDWRPMLIGFGVSLRLPKK